MQTALDRAFDHMQQSPDDPEARLGWFNDLAATELFLLLEDEAAGDKVRPRVFPVEGAELVLVFDREARLTDFIGGAAPYVALSGRALIGLLQNEGLGLIVNPGCNAEMMLDASMIKWFAETLANAPDEVDERLVEIRPPAGVPEAFLSAIDSRLATAQGLARCAYLVATRKMNGGAGHMLAFIDPVPGAQAALTQLIAETVTFSGLEAAELDVSFFQTSDPISARLESVGLRFELPDPITPTPLAPPGSDPSKPPRLK